MYAKMGFNAQIINRIHYTLKESWKQSKHLEFLWRGSNSLGEEVEMFTHVLDSHYSFPSGFNFETDAPITDANIATRAQCVVILFTLFAGGSPPDRQDPRQRVPEAWHVVPFAPSLDSGRR